MEEMIKSITMAAGVCFVATELAGLIVAGVPVHYHIATSSFIRTLLVGVLVTAVPAAVYAVVMAAITRWLKQRNKRTISSYLWSLVLTSVAFLACVPCLLYFHVPLIPDYRRMTSEHYFLWSAALAAGIVGTWAVNTYWRRALARQSPVSAHPLAAQK